MKTIFFCLLFLVVLPWKSQAQIRVYSFEVQPQYLTSAGKIEIDNFSPTTTIQFDVTYTSFRTGVNPNPGYSLTTRLATHNGSSRIYFSPAVTYSSSSFPSGVFTPKVTYSAEINKSQLTGNKLYLYMTSSDGLDGFYTSKDYQYEIASPDVTINSVNFQQNQLIGPDCGFTHTTKMEKGVYNCVYTTNYTNNTSYPTNDITFEYLVQDDSQSISGQKQFLIAGNAGNTVTFSGNDYLDSYDSKVTVRAKSISTGAYLSTPYTFIVDGVWH